MTDRHFWTTDRVARVTELAVAGVISSAIAADIGTTQASVLTFCGRRGIAVVKYSPEQQRIYDERARLREASRNARKRAHNQAKLIAARKIAIANAPALTTAIPKPKLNTMELRRVFHIPEMSKADQRAFLADAVRNTAQMQVGEG
jgi:hypothetical protein